MGGGDHRDTSNHWLYLACCVIYIGVVQGIEKGISHGKVLLCKVRRLQVSRWNVARRPAMEVDLLEVHVESLRLPDYFQFSIAGL
jgi:hypothetical protein